MRGRFGLYSIAAIQLVGLPYVNESLGVDTNAVFDSLVSNEKYCVSLQDKISKHAEHLSPLRNLGYHGLYAKIKEREPLTFEESFSLASFVSMSSNHALYDELHQDLPMVTDKETLRMQAVSLLSGMSVKESLIGLKPQEIAGLVAGVLDLDTVVRVPSEESAFMFGGMGGDRGLPAENDGVSKLFSASTLAALALGQFGNVHKHHSYPNTSRVAGQSAVESMGARSDFQTEQEFTQALDHSHIIMTSCHSTRTIHRLSHRLKGETINHIIGPLAAPHNATDTLHALIGVNHNVHPQTIIEALKILQERGIQRYGNSVAFCGLDVPYDAVNQSILDAERYYTEPSMKQRIALDEVSPPPFATMASFLVNGENIGVLIAPEDFMDAAEAAEMEHDGLLIPNTTEEIIKANTDVIYNKDAMKAQYVAMTAALALFTRDYASYDDAFDRQQHRLNSRYLRTCYQEALSKIQSESYHAQTQLYVESTRRDSLPNCEAVIFDVDNTLIKPNNPAFYRNFSHAVDAAVSRYLGVDMAEGKRIADFYRTRYGGGERALFQADIHKYFPEYPELPPNYELLYDEMCAISPDGFFDQNEQLLSFLNLLKSQGKKIVALTDAPEDLSRHMLALSGVNPDEVFDGFYAYQREVGPLKILFREQIFSHIADRLQIKPDRILAVGDTPESDIVPAKKIGMKTCLLRKRAGDEEYGLHADQIFDVPSQYRSYY